MWLVLFTLPTLAADDIVLGSFTTTPAGSAMGYDLAGRAMLLRSGGTTSAWAQLTGLDPDTSFGTHVHALPCDLADGGGHYKIDPNEPYPVEANEIWPTVVSDANGDGLGSASVAHVARGDAQAIVVHASDGTRIACATLRPAVRGAAVVHGGTFSTTADGANMGYAIDGHVQLVANGPRTWVRSTAWGLDPDTTMGSHVHDMICGINAGGGHYKIDPAEPYPVQANEIWPVLVTDPAGLGHGEADVPHRARGEAQSVVIHAADGTRIACANLQPPNRAAMTNGTFTMTRTAVERGFALSGRAEMARFPTAGTTRVDVRMRGLAPDTDYGAHVHDRPCSQGGGGHYKIDPSVPDPEEDNEIWPLVHANAVGTGTGSDVIVHLARPEAQSVVVHDTDGARLACADLDH